MEIEKILERVGNVKLKGGIFAKVTWAVMVISVCVTVLAVALGNIYVTTLTIAGMFGFAFIFFNKLLKFAETYPQAAILDGAEFLMHEQIVHASKDQSTLSSQNNVVDHAQPEIDLAIVNADEDSLPKQIEGQ